MVAELRTRARVHSNRISLGRDTKGSRSEQMKIYLHRSEGQVSTLEMIDVLVRDFDDLSRLQGEHVRYAPPEIG